MDDGGSVVIIDNEYATLKCLPDKGILYHVLHKPVPDEMMKELLLAGRDTMREYGVSKWLTDDRLNGPLSEEFREWARTVWQAQMVEAGWRFWAMVVPADLHSAFTLTGPFEEIFNRGVRIATFMEVDEAFQWLESTE